MPLSCVSAQEAPRVRNFSPDEYKRQNQNWSLAQSPEGWIWAGNNGGLLEFDGVRWHTWALPDRQTVRAVAIGPQGEVFCGGFAEFGYWKRDAFGQLKYTSLSHDVRSNRMGKEEIWHIFQGQGCVYFQSFSVIYKYDYQKVTEIIPPEAVMFATVADGRILIPVIGQGLYELLPDGTFRFVAGTEILKDRIVQFLLPQSDGEIWAGTTNNGIFIVKNGVCRPWQHPLNEAFKKLQLNKAIRLQDGGTAFGTILGGLFILSSDGVLRYRLNRGNGLQNNTVLALLEDHDGNLWSGLDRGIDFVQLRSPLAFFDDQAGRIGAVYTAAQWQGNLYVGTNQGVFYRPIKLPKEHSNRPFQLVEGSQGQVWELQVFDNQLICGHNSGTFRIEGGQARKISGITGGWSTVRAPSQTDLLLQGTYTGLVCFRKDGAGNWFFSHKIEGFAEPVREIAFDENGNVWATHPNWGLFLLRLSPDYKRVEEMKTLTKSDGLPTDFHLDLVRIGQHLYINTEWCPVAPKVAPDKQVVFDWGDRRKKPRHKWLSGADVEYFELDSLGLWLQTPWKRVSLPLQLIPKYENIVSFSDSTYLFCLESGYAVFDRRLLGAPATLCPVPIRPYLRLLQTSDGATQIPGPGLSLDYAQNSLKFVFALPFYERNPQFSWRLDGYSKNWSEWQHNGEKEFVNLPEGQYTFRVRSDVSEEETTLVFKISPPWYRSWWAYTVYVGLLIAGLWQFERYNRRRLDRQRRRLESEKEREILLLEVENKSRELSNAAFNLIRKNEALQGLKDELLASPNDPRALQKMVRHIDEHLEGDHDWEIFEESFNRVHDDFFKRLMQQYPDLTQGDLRLAAYLKMNLSSKEIAPLLNISVRGIENKRYRLRKKLGLPEEANLAEFIMAF